MKKYHRRKEKKYRKDEIVFPVFFYKTIYSENLSAWEWMKSASK